jgi:hypothetical protein
MANNYYKSKYGKKDNRATRRAMEARAREKETQKAKEVENKGKLSIFKKAILGLAAIGILGGAVDMNKPLQSETDNFKDFQIEKIESAASGVNHDIEPEPTPEPDGIEPEPIELDGEMEEIVVVDSSLSKHAAFKTALTNGYIAQMDSVLNAPTTIIEKANGVLNTIDNIEDDFKANKKLNKFEKQQILKSVKNVDGAKTAVSGYAVTKAFGALVESELESGKTALEKDMALEETYLDMSYDLGASRVYLDHERDEIHNNMVGTLEYAQGVVKRSEQVFEFGKIAEPVFECETVMPTPAPETVSVVIPEPHFEMPHGATIALPEIPMFDVADGDTTPTFDVGVKKLSNVQNSLFDTTNLRGNSILQK